MHLPQSKVNATLTQLCPSLTSTSFESVSMSSSSSIVSISAPLSLAMSPHQSLLAISHVINTSLPLGHSLWPFALSAHFHFQMPMQYQTPCLLHSSHPLQLHPLCMHSSPFTLRQSQLSNSQTRLCHCRPVDWPLLYRGKITALSHFLMSNPAAWTHQRTQGTSPRLSQVNRSPLTPSTWWCHNHTCLLLSLTLDP